LINEAYAVLADPVRRADYDRQLSLPSRGAASDPDQPPAHAACAFCHAPHAEGAPLESDSLCAVCGSPLYPAAKRRLERSGRRGVARIGTQQRIKFFTAWPQAAAHVGEAQDISPKGLRFVSAHAVVVGQVLKLECEPCSAVVRVVDCLELRAEGRMRWLVRAEFLTVRFQDPRGGFVSAWV
jgi:hypothetical protein